MKTRNTLLPLLVCGCMVLLHSLAAETEPNQRLADELVQAHEKTRRAEYISEISRPDLPMFPKITRAVFYCRHGENGMPLRRADFYQNSRLVWSFLQNEAGKFGVHNPSGKVAQGGDFLELYYLAELGDQPHAAELAWCSAQEEPQTYQNRPARHLTVVNPGKERTGEAEIDLAYLRGYTMLFNDVTCAKIKAKHPFVREYTIDDATGVILKLRKFNWHGKLLSDTSLGDVELTPDWKQFPELFATPDHIDYLVATTEQFVRLIRQPPPPVTDDKPKSRRGNLPKEHRYGQYLKFALLAIGCIFVGCACWLRKRR